MTPVNWLRKNKQHSCQGAASYCTFCTISVYLFRFLTFICVVWVRMVDATGNNAANIQPVLNRCLSMFSQ